MAASRYIDLTRYTLSNIVDVVRRYNTEPVYRLGFADALVASHFSPNGIPVEFVVRVFGRIDPAYNEFANLNLVNADHTPNRDAIRTIGQLFTRFYNQKIQGSLTGFNLLERELKQLSTNGTQLITGEDIDNFLPNKTLDPRGALVDEPKTSQPKPSKPIAAEPPERTILRPPPTRPRGSESREQKPAEGEETAAQRQAPSEGITEEGARQQPSETPTEPSQPSPQPTSQPQTQAPQRRTAPPTNPGTGKPGWPFSTPLKRMSIPSIKNVLPKHLPKFPNRKELQKRILGNTPSKKAARFFLFILLLLLVFGILSAIFSFIQETENQLQVPISLEKVAVVEKIDNNTNPQFKLTVAHTGTGLADIQVDDPIPSGMAIDKNLTSDEAEEIAFGINAVVRWVIKDLPPNTPKVLTLTYKPVKDRWIENKAAEAKILKETPITEGTPLPTTQISATPIAIPSSQGPNQENCSGTYSLRNPLGNFGDPSCSFNKDDLYTLVKQNDPENADYWFFTIINCESGYNPNAYADPIIVGTPDPGGAWGLYQMGRGRAGQFDHGDAIWQEQALNAINHNKFITNLGLAWRYWQCAKDRW